jgi:ABC-2 type transport system permease protein
MIRPNHREVAVPPSSWFPAALWVKALGEARLLLVAEMIAIIVFGMIYVWLISQVDLRALATFLKALPATFERVAGVPFRSIATPEGRLAMFFVDPVTAFVAASWSIARGSDCISGEIGRGTMELLLAQPVRRTAIVVVQAVVTTAGAALIALSIWLGIWLGMRFTGFAAQIEPARFMPSAMNVFGLMFFLTAFSTLISAFGRDRRRTVGLAVGFYLVQVLMKIIAQAAPAFGWLRYGTFLGAFEPQSLAIHPETAWAELAWRNGCLIGLGITAYAAAATVFCRRDLPAPL